MYVGNSCVLSFSTLTKVRKTTTIVDGSEQLSLFVKPSNHEQKKKRKYKNDIGRRENMAYDAEKDEYTCAQGQKLQAVAVKKRKSETGYVQEVTVYECAGCKDCPVKEKCIRQKKTDKTPLADRVKRLNVSKYFIAQREAMEKKISTEEGILLRVNRSIQSDGVFAMVSLLPDYEGRFDAYFYSFMIHNTLC